MEHHQFIDPFILCGVHYDDVIIVDVNIIAVLPDSIDVLTETSCFIHVRINQEDNDRILLYRQQLKFWNQLLYHIVNLDFAG